MNLDEIEYNYGDEYYQGKTCFNCLYDDKKKLNRGVYRQLLHDMKHIMIRGLDTGTVQRFYFAKINKYRDISPYP